jgi:hypothetical protein
MSNADGKPHFQCLEIKLLKALAVNPGLPFMPELSRQGDGECRSSFFFAVARLSQAQFAQLHTGFDQFMAELAEVLVLLGLGPDLIDGFVGNRPGVTTQLGPRPFDPFFAQWQFGFPHLRNRSTSEPGNISPNAPIASFSSRAFTCSCSEVFCGVSNDCLQSESGTAVRLIGENLLVDQDPHFNDVRPRISFCLTQVVNSGNINRLPFNE